MKRQIMIITLLLSFVLGFTALSADSDFYVIPVKKTSPNGGALHLIDGNGVDRGFYIGGEEGMFDPNLGVTYGVDPKDGYTNPSYTSGIFYFKGANCTGEWYATDDFPPWATYSHDKVEGVYKSTGYNDDMHCGSPGCKWHKLEDDQCLDVDDRPNGATRDRVNGAT